MSAASSESTSPATQSTALRSPRVCLNCRRKKKQCDKALPSCGRCTYSLEVCQHEDDAAPAAGSAFRPANFEQFVTQYASQSPVLSMDPMLESLLNQPPGARLGTLSPSWFVSLDSGESIHTLMLRGLAEMVGPRPKVEHIVSLYFGSVNTWFTIIERSTFESQVEDMWGTPSAETALLLICMMLITRPPHENQTLGMDDHLYLTVKAGFTLVQNRVTLSFPILQAKLLIAMYEYSHSMPQQAYISLGNCVQMSKTFGWYSNAYWSGERQRQFSTELKLSSIMFWAVVYIDCLLHISFPDQKYPLTVVDPDFSLPLPQALDQYLQGAAALGFQEGEGLADASNDSIEDILWPEANSAWYLSSFLHQIRSSTPLTTAARNSLSDAVTAHTLNIMGVNWRFGARSATMHANFITLMKVNQPYLIPGRAASPGSSSGDSRPVETITSVINSVYNISQSLNSTLTPQQLAPVSPTGAFCMYYASMLLMSHGDNTLNDPAWMTKVESFQRTLRLFSKRWRIAAKYVESIDLAFVSRMD